MPNNQLTDFGYDRTREPLLPKTKPKLKSGAALLSRSIVGLDFLPPVGQQGTAEQPGYPGSCCAWAASYGFATFYAAQNNGVDPSTAEGQASPACIYISVISNHGGKAGQCQGSAYNDYWVLLQQNGTANMDVAPYTPNCANLWKDYASGDCPSDLNFKIPLVAAMDSSNLDDIKTVISNGKIVAFATELYSDWGGL